MELLILASAKSVLTTLLSIVYFFVCLILIMIVLMQRGSEGGGLGGAFGGGGAESAFGVKANLAFKKTTAIVSVVFVTLSLGLAWLQRPDAAPTEPGVENTDPNGVLTPGAGDPEGTGEGGMPAENPAGTE